MKTRNRRKFWTRFSLVVSIILLACNLTSVEGATPVSTKVTKVTSSSISIQVTTSININAYIEFGDVRNKYNQRTTTRPIKKGGAEVFVLEGLAPNKEIYYRIRFATTNKKTFSATAQNASKTSNTSSEFIFAIQADPHMDQNSSAEVWTATLSQIVKDNPAFLMDLGDIFMTDKLTDKSETNIRNRFELMKSYYDKLGSVPYYFTLGNHDGELGYSNFNTKKYRKEYFPDQTGDLAYYSFTTPDSLHIVLDIFTYTTSNPKDDGWQWTLGKTQYDWLKSTLENSSAPNKFIYVHHLLYGNAQSRGGSEKAKYNEWGGLNIDGTPGFSEKRPGWGKPVHQLLVDNGVDFVFKGHDHIYVKQELDGIIYQTLPQPSHPGDKTNSAAEYGYEGGRVIGGSGFLRVTTSSSSIKVEFIKYDGSILDSYTKS